MKKRMKNLSEAQKRQFREFQRLGIEASTKSHSRPIREQSEAAQKQFKAFRMAGTKKGKKARLKGYKKWWDSLTPEEQMEELRPLREGYERWWNSMTLDEQMSMMIPLRKGYERWWNSLPEEQKNARMSFMRLCRREIWKEKLRELYGFPKDAVFIPMRRKDYWFIANVLRGDKFYSYCETDLLEDPFKRYLWETREP